MSKQIEQITWFLFVAVILAIYLFALDLPLLGPDEPRYAQVAREMYDRGDWVTTTLGEFNWFEKPALLYWLQIAFYNLFGVNEFAARFGSALFGLGTIFSLWCLGKNHSGGDRYSLAKWMMLISASSLGLIVFSRGASFDIIITFPITASLVSFFIWENNQKAEHSKSPVHNYLPLILFYFFVGIGVIGKGLIGIVFPVAIVSFYYVLKWEFPRKTLILSLLWGTVLSTLIAAVWYLPMYLQNGWEFIDDFFIQHHFQRFTSNKYKHPQPFWFFWVIFPLFTIPWIPFFAASIWSFVKETTSRKGTKEQNQLRITNYELRLFGAVWMLVPIVFFSISGSKLPGYILPALPGACILTAEYVYRFVQKNLLRKYLLQGLVFLTFAIIAILLQFVVPNFAKQDSTKHLVETANRKGYKTEKILNLHTINHNIEFYGRGRLVREPDGKLRKFAGIAEIIEYLENERLQSILILVPHEFVSQLTENSLIDAKILDKNAELEFVAVKLR